MKKTFVSILFLGLIFCMVSCKFSSDYVDSSSDFMGAANITTGGVFVIAPETGDEIAAPEAADGAASLVTGDGIATNKIENGGASAEIPSGSKLAISNLRYAASVADIKAGKLSPTLKSGTAPVIAFDIPADLSIASVDIFKGVLENGRQIVLMAILDYKPSSVEGNTCLFDYPHLFTIDPAGASFFRIVAKDEFGHTVESTVTVNVAAAVSAAPRASNFRWNSTGDVRTSDQAKWKPDRIRLNSPLWIGIDSTEVAESITFSVRGFVGEMIKWRTYTMTPQSDPGYIGLGENNGFIWAKFPELLNYIGTTPFKVTVNFRDGTSESFEGSVTVWF